MRRTPVRILGEQRAETDGHRDVVVLGEANDLIARRHCIAGSGPMTSSTSVDGSDAAHTSTVGQTIWRCPSSITTNGRTVAKSVNGSGSSSAT